MAISASAPANHIIVVPDDLIQSSCEEKSGSYLKNTITIGGGTALGITTIYLGATIGIATVTVISLSCSVGFFALKFIDTRCSRGSKTDEIHQESLKKSATIAELTSELTETKEIVNEYIGLAAGLEERDRKIEEKRALFLQEKAEWELLAKKVNSEIKATSEFIIALYKTSSAIQRNLMANHA